MIPSADTSNYKNSVLATNPGLIKTAGSRPQMLADSKTNFAGVDKSAARGRASVRIQSKKVYNSEAFSRRGTSILEGTFVQKGIFGRKGTCEMVGTFTIVHMFSKSI
jgi:hypothetical protein